MGRRADTDLKQAKINTLIKLAKEAAANSYAPFSKLKVGAALEARSGKIYKGCNIENASFSLTICAERVALFNAVAAGERQFRYLAVVGLNSCGEFNPIIPCGACLQAFSEFSINSLKLVLLDASGKSYIKTISELLPLPFKFAV